MKLLGRRQTESVNIRFLINRFLALKFSKGIANLFSLPDAGLRITFSGRNRRKEDQQLQQERDQQDE